MAAPRAAKCSAPDWDLGWKIFQRCLARLIHTRKLVNPTWVLVVIEDHYTKGCDVAMYEKSGNNGGVLRLNQIIGYEAEYDPISLKLKTGMELCMNQLSGQVAKSGPSIYLYCNGPKNKANRVNIIRSATTETQRVELVELLEPLEGASILACVKYNQTYRTEWEHKFPFANWSNIFRTLPNSTHCQVDHIGHNLSSDLIEGKSKGVKHRNDLHFRNLESVKNSVKERFIRMQDKISESQIKVLEGAVTKIMNEHLSAHQVRSMWYAARQKIG